MNRGTRGCIIGCISVIVSIFALFSSNALARQSVVENQNIPSSNQHNLEVKTKQESLIEGAKQLLKIPAEKRQARIESDLQGLT